MRMKIDDLPVVREQLGEMIRGVDADGMSCAFMQFPAGTDFCPLLEGLPNDHCQCPHWGYLIEGRIRVTYEDGSEEVVEAGEIYSWRAGHTVLIEESTKQVEFSPSDEMKVVLDHVVGKVGG